MSKYIEPSIALERDGDIISGADFNSFEHNLPLLEETDDVAEYAVRVAEDIIDTAKDTEVKELSVAEKAYNELEDRVEKAMDQGLDAKATRYQLDPTGKIQAAYGAEQRAKQDATNHRHSEAIRQALHEANLAATEQIQDPVARKRAVDELMARKRVADERRGRRS